MIPKNSRPVGWIQGYHNRPEETAAVIRDGWLHTGDLGYLDEAGRLHVTGRKKEILALIARGYFRLTARGQDKAKKNS